MFSLALSSGVGISVLQFYYARVMSRSCCGVAELNGVIKSCEGFGALIRCTVSNHKIGGILRDMAGNLQVTWSWRGRKDVFVFVVGQGVIGTGKPP